MADGGTSGPQDAARPRPGLLSLVLGVIAVAQLAVLAYRARDIVLFATSNADLSSPLTMGRAAAHYPGSVLVTGNYAWWDGLWVTQLLSHLPGYTTTSNYGALALSLAAMAVLGLVARRLFGATAALLAVLVLLAVGPDPLSTYSAWSSRAPTWWATVGAIAVVATLPAPGRRRWPWLVAAAAVALWGAAALAGDKLAYVAVVAPLAAVAVHALVGRAFRLAAVAGVLAGAITGLSFAVCAIAEANGYSSTPAPLKLVTFDILGTQAANAFYALQQFWRGGNPGTLLPLGAGYLGALIAVAALVVGLQRVLRRAAWTRAADPLDAARGAWTVFWLTALLAVLAAFVATTASGVLGQPVLRYLHLVPFASAGLVAALAAGQARRVALVAVVPVVVLALASIVVAARGDHPEAALLHRPAIGNVTAAVKRYRLDRGYASYWTAAPMAHASDYALDLTPAGGCAGDGSGRYELCPPPLHYITGAYKPQRGVRSYVLIDLSPAGYTGVIPTSVIKALPDVGRAERVLDVGDGLRMAIYPYDVAGRFRGATP